MSDSLDLITELLAKTDLNGRFKVRPISQIRMKSGRYRLGIYRQKSVAISLKPGDNGTAWEWAVEPPHHISAAKLHAALDALEKSPEDALAAAAPRIVKASAVLELAQMADELEAAPVVAAAPEPPIPLAPLAPLPLPPPPPPITQPTADTYLDGREEDEMSRIMNRLTLAGTRAQDYLARAATLAKLKTDMEAAELAIVTAQEAYDKAVLERDAAQATYDKAKKHYDSVRNQHVTDDKGKNAVQFMQSLKSLDDQ